MILIQLHSTDIQPFIHLPNIYWVPILTLDTGDLWKQDRHDPYYCEAQSLLGKKVSKYNSTIKKKLRKLGIIFHENK